ncbi:MAG: hypothetical protein JKY00_04160 [Roseicyclus sp.]|nr:hypothetical protein [Roseicyclus sp.]
MKRLAIAAALAASFAAPAFADGHTTNFAIMHLNMSAENESELIMVPQGDIMMADLEMGSTLADVFRQLNLSAETMADLRGQGETVTIIMSDPTYAAEIFRRLMDADDDN